MTADAHLIWTFLCVLIRVGAALLASPLFGGAVPVQIRVFLSGAIAFAIVPVVQPLVGTVPQEMGSLVAGVVREAGVGLLIGFCLQALMSAVQMAGSVLDLQLGLSGAQVFDPVSGSASSVLSQFKFWCAVCILFSVNGHHLLLKGVASSYEMTNISFANLFADQSVLLQLLGQLGLLSLQIAAPVAAVAFVLDGASALINKAVPQFQVFAVMTPAKIAMGTVAVMGSLPILASAVTTGVEHTFFAVEQILGGQ